MKTPFTLLLLALSYLASAQKFDVADFTAKEEVARWLCAYDEVAWHTSDSVLALADDERQQLGGEWFCIKDEGKDTWQAYYGKYAERRFTRVIHYSYTNGKINRQYNKVDTAALSLYASALQLAARQRMVGLRDSFQLQFNQYIQRNADKTFSVWIFPAFQPNSVAVYGGEFIYTINAEGTSILKDESYLSGKFLGFKVEREAYDVHLNYEQVNKPTLGAVFFALYYAPYFKNITIQTAKNTSILFNDGGNRFWSHIEGAPPVSKGDKKKKK